MTKTKDKKSSRWTWVRDAFLGLLVIGGVMTYQTWDHVGGGPAPAFDLAVLDAENRVSTSDLQGKPTVLYFWAPWCGVCEANSHNLTAVQEAVGDDANVLSVVLEYNSPNSAREFVKRNEATYPVLLGSAAERDAYAVTSFPTLYVLDPDGTVSTSVVGYTTELGIRARLWWAGI